ncbi:hypothetical protein GCM10029964_078340 [Kibdelosporangium lantanae]
MADPNDGTDSRAYWLDVLHSGGFTPLTLFGVSPDRPPGETGTYRTEIHLGPDALLATHAKVLAALTGDRHVTTGYLPAPEADPLPVRLTADDSLRQAAERSRADVVRHGAEALADVRDLLENHDPLFDTTVSPFGVPPGLPAGVALCVALDGPNLVLLYDKNRIDPATAARIGGYLGSDRENLLSDEESAFLLDGLAGPVRHLPDRGFHELFEDRVRQHPDAVAAVHGERSWTYDELNRRANRIAWKLRDTGLRDEDVVAVVAERTLDWVAAIIGVLKAGGGYLPVEPQFPAERIATMLRRSGCRRMLTTRESRPDVGPVETFLVEDLDGPDHNPGIPVAAGQLAYIYFTSGSTGAPKGAMCEHAGLLNHLHAKIEDLGLDAASVVAQTAPQCFDISLWQVAAPLLTGGRTHIVGPEVLLDPGRFARTLVSGGVTVTQLVPSYLDVFLTHVEREPVALPALRCVSATGEALKAATARRWFDAFPDIALVNAYGLTETSDDTNHEILHQAPEGRSVALGRPVRNVRVYVVDENLALVPFGAPGEILFSGVCVGRGYVNDPERTRAAFLTDPWRPDTRVYRSGDFGRWLPDGRLEFLGRRDSQVKVRGFRIETGEIEQHLVRIPDVRDAAVVVAGTGLVGFYTGSDLAPAAVQDALAKVLPGYMVPDHLRRLPGMPLTANGKIDRGALVRTARESTMDTAATADDEPPRDQHERRIAELWAEVLQVPVARIRRASNFFELGGTSLAAIRLAIALDRRISVRDLVRTPVLADLAGSLSGSPTEGRS